MQLIKRVLFGGISISHPLFSYTSIHPHMIIRHYLLLPLEVCFFKSFLGSALVEQWSSFNQERFMIEVPF